MDSERTANRERNCDLALPSHPHAVRLSSNTLAAVHGLTAETGGRLRIACYAAKGSAMRAFSASGSWWDPSSFALHGLRYRGIFLSRARFGRQRLSAPRRDPCPSGLAFAGHL